MIEMNIVITKNSVICVSDAKYDCIQYTFSELKQELKYEQLHSTPTVV